jgi:16S rRNA (cytidine1402-2'-O)-methyltransferase
MTNTASSTIYLIPTFLDQNNLEVIPPYIVTAVKQCTVFFVENQRSARRYLKRMWKEMVIDDYLWYGINKQEEDAIPAFKKHLANGSTIGILSEAGCPGIADPGQLLISIAQQNGAIIKPLTGPNSIILALMASGLNGQQFHFNGYLPIEDAQRVKTLKQLEQESATNNCTQIFIETPYRNNQLIATACKTLHLQTLFCVACDITGKNETIRTLSIAQWKLLTTDFHKRPAIFLLKAQR